jgi:hypothetical protein
MGGLNIELDPEALRPIIDQAITEALNRQEQFRELLDGRLAFSEAEAAALLGLNEHQLRGERRRRRIEHCRVVGNKVRYTVLQLMNYLNRASPGEEKSAERKKIWA